MTKLKYNNCFLARTDPKDAMMIMLMMVTMKATITMTIFRYGNCFLAPTNPKDAMMILLMMVTMKATITMTLFRYNNCFLARTDPKDVARTEGRTFLCSDEKRDSIPCVDTAQVMMMMIMMMMKMMTMIVRCDQVDPSWISIYRPANSPGCIFNMSSYKIADNDDDILVSCLNLLWCVIYCNKTCPHTKLVTMMSIANHLHNVLIANFSPFFTFPLSRPSHPTFLHFMVFSIIQTIYFLNGHDHDIH